MKIELRTLTHSMAVYIRKLQQQQKIATHTKNGHIAYDDNELAEYKASSVVGRPRSHIGLATMTLQDFIIRGYNNDIDQDDKDILEQVIKVCNKILEEN